MDKKKQMNFNLNNFLLATSIVLDFKQKEKYNVSLNHYKRVAYISLKLGLLYKLDPKQMSDLCSLSLVYNLQKEDLEDIPFLNKDETLNNKLFEDFILLSSLIDKKFFLGIDSIENRIKAKEFVRDSSLFSNDIKDAFLDISSNISFWLDLLNENDILMFIYSNLQDFTSILPFEEVLKLTRVFHKYENPRSVLLQMCGKIIDKYDFDHKDKQTFLIAASLQNIGKLVIPTNILEKKEELSSNEYEIIKSYPYYTKKVLNNIMGFNDINSWASKIQERLDGSGYPERIDARNLSLKDRLLFTLNIYHALREQKNYRNEYTHDEAIKIMKKEADNNKIDLSLVEDFDNFFKN